MKILKLLASVILLLTSFVSLYGVRVKVDPSKIIRTVKLHACDDRSLVVRFDFMNMKDFEEIRFKERIDVSEQGGSDICSKIVIRTPKIKGELQKLYNNLGRNAPVNPKVCFVRFENFVDAKLKINLNGIEESLKQFFMQYGIGSFYSLPKQTTVGRCCSSIFELSEVAVLLLPFIIWVTLSYFKGLHPGIGLSYYDKPNPWKNSYCFDRDVTFIMILIYGSALISLTISDYMSPFFTKDVFFPRKVKRFSERTDVVPEEGIFFVIDNEFLEKCWEELEKMDLQVEEVGGKVLFKFKKEGDDDDEPSLERHCKSSGEKDLDRQVVANSVVQEASQKNIVTQELIDTWRYPRNRTSPGS